MVLLHRPDDTALGSDHPPVHRVSDLSAPVGGLEEGCKAVLPASR